MRGWVEQLSIVRKCVKDKFRVENNLRKWMCEVEKEQRPKGRALGSLLGSEVMSSTIKVINLSVMWERHHWKARYVMSKVVQRRIGSMSLFIVSKAEDRSKSELGNLSVVSVAKKAVGDMTKGSLSTIVVAISRLFQFKEWYGHVSRSLGLAKTILKSTVKGGRRQGWQRKRWEDNITGVCQVPEGSGEKGKMEETGCKITCGAQTTLAVKG